MTTKALARFALAFGLVACSGGGGVGSGDDSATGEAAPSVDQRVAEEDAQVSEKAGIPGGTRQFARIPARFRGVWARSVEECRAENRNRFTVTGEAISFFDGGGAAGDIRGRDEALAVTLAGQSAVYLAMEGDGQMRVRRGGGESATYRRCPSSVASAQGAASTTVPERFRGVYAPDRQACALDYTYNPAFRAVTVGASEVSFFETGGPVTDVVADGNSVAITLRETVGDGESTRAIYLALNADGTARYRPGSGEPVETFVVCGSE
ncbi:hypothetical protein [Qipengyuania sp. JC766]|uniref:hypothetical protein n=1 Tax=Qipengyuania sp. JC766 TaxID=3232139 RepID=UPI003457EB24